MRNIANMSEGLENRIESLLKTSINLNDLYDEVKTKRYTHSRVRRAVLSMMFGVTNDDIAIQVPYCRMLGFNTSASNEIGKLIDNCKIPFIVNYSDFSKFDNPEIRRIFGLENKSTDIYNLMLNSTDTCSKEMTYWPKKIWWFAGNLAKFIAILIRKGYNILNMLKIILELFKWNL